MSAARKSPSTKKTRNDTNFKGWVETADGQKWTDPFERKREVLQKAGAPSTLIDAAIYVNDTLDVASAIARTHFSDPTPETVIAVYRLLSKRHASLEDSKAEEPGE